MGRFSIPATFIEKHVALHFSLWCVSMPSPIINLMLNQIITQTSYIPILQIKNLNAQQMNVHPMFHKKTTKTPPNKHLQCFVWVYLSQSPPATPFSPIFDDPSDAESWMASCSFNWPQSFAKANRHRCSRTCAAIAWAWLCVAPLFQGPKEGGEMSESSWWKMVVFQENLDKILIQ